MSMIIEKTMFREYDIRGRESDSELNSASVSVICKAYAKFMIEKGERKVVVGHDNRASSEEFYKAAVDALVSSGMEVIGIGMCLTPHVYFSHFYFKTRAGVMITASHNPAGWNGLKLGADYGLTLNKDEIQEIYGRVLRQDFASGEGSFKEEKIDKIYQDDLIARVTLKKPLKIVLNTGNATSSFFSPAFFRAFDCEVIEQNTNPDPTYPNYPPNPANVDMMEDIGRRVVEVGADLGIGIDADGDRLGVADEKGNIVWPDAWIALLARQVLEKTPGSKIVFDVKVSESLPEDIIAHGGVPVMWKTGHSYMKQKMREVDAPFAGEMSGHVFIKDGYYGYDDAHFCALKLLEYISGQDKTLSEIMQTVPKYFSTPAYHAHADDDVKYGIVEEMTQMFKQEGYRVIDINGARVYMEDGWGLIRATSNLPAVVLRFEAKTQEGLDKIEQIFKEKLKKYPQISQKWESA